MKEKNHYLKNLLPLSFYQRDTALVAKELLGHFLFHKDGDNLLIGRIVETEAYLGEDDPASHSYKGITPRCKTMFKEAGLAYIYQIYGIHYCFNITTEFPGIGTAVLIRSLEPIMGINLMKKRRNRDRLRDLCSGPAKLVQALGIRKEQDGLSLFDGTIGVSEGSYLSPQNIFTTTRVGITKGVELPLRFYIKNNEFISKK